MIVSFFDQTLVINDVGGKSKISANTPQLRFLVSHKSDIQKETGALVSVLSEITESPKYIFDLMAGSGFSGKVFKSIFPDSFLVLNDISEDCYNCLKYNFPDDFVLNCSAEDVDLDFNPDLVFIDFNTLTFKKKNDFLPLFKKIEKWKPKYFIFADSAVYGFKFKKNLDSYSIKCKYEYFIDIWGGYLKEIGQTLYRVCDFGNAALILSVNKDMGVWPGDIFLDFDPVKFEFKRASFGVRKGR
jgi:hypothetical protein